MHRDNLSLNLWRIFADYAIANLHSSPFASIKLAGACRPM
jgi:hypothetical protein